MYASRDKKGVIKRETSPILFHISIVNAVLVRIMDGGWWLPIPPYKLYYHNKTYDPLSIVLTTTALIVEMLKKITF